MPVPGTWGAWSDGPDRVRSEALRRETSRSFSGAFAGELPAHPHPPLILVASQHLPVDLPESPDTGRHDADADGWPLRGQIHDARNLNPTKPGGVGFAGDERWAKCYHMSLWWTPFYQ